MESSRKDDVKLIKEGENFEREGKSFAMPKYIILMEEQRDSEAGEADKGGRGTL